MEMNGFNNFLNKNYKNSSKKINNWFEFVEDQKNIISDLYKQNQAFISQKRDPTDDILNGILFEDEALINNIKKKRIYVKKKFNNIKLNKIFVI